MRTGRPFGGYKKKWGLGLINIDLHNPMISTITYCEHTEFILKSYASSGAGKASRKISSVFERLGRRTGKLCTAISVLSSSAERVGWFGLWFYVSLEHLKAKMDNELL
jgi:hypothetical protein